MDSDDRLFQWLTRHSSIPHHELEKAQAESVQQGTTVLDRLISRGFVPAQQRQAILQAALGSHDSARHHPVSRQVGLQLYGYEGIERYSILEEIGSGGMGRVFLAQVKETGHPVVIKTLLKVDHSQTQVDRFHREGMALARLSHPNIARVYDFRLSESQSPGTYRPYLVMEHIQGQTLVNFLEKSRDVNRSITDADLLQRIFLPLADALQHCHQNGIIHRDLKPENILVEVPDDQDSTPRPVLIDFGLVRIDKDTLRESLELSQQLTQSGQFLGSPAFAAPEQLHGDIEKFGSAIDVWGFGATLYWAFTDKAPYDSHSLIELYATANQRNPRPLREYQPNAPPWLDYLCAQCLQRDPGKRITIQQVIEILRTRQVPSWRKAPIVAVFSLLVIMALFSISIFSSKDSTPPTLTLKLGVSPSRNSLSKLSGNIFHNHSALIWVQQKSQGLASKTKSYVPRTSGAFRVSLALTEGQNDFMVWAEDEDGLRSQTQSFTIVRDSTPPKFTELNYSKVCYDEEVQISGKVNEAATVTIGKKTVTAQTQFSISVPLSLGVNTVALSLIDACKNQNQKTIKIFRKKVYYVLPKGQLLGKANSFSGLKNAVQKAPKNARLHLGAGVYSANIKVTKPLTIVGIGDPNDVVLNSSKSPLQLLASGITLRNLRVESVPTQRGGEAIKIFSDDCTFDQCIFYAPKAAALTIERVTQKRDESGNTNNWKETRIVRCQFIDSLVGLLSRAGGPVLVKDTLFKSNSSMAARVFQETTVRFVNTKFLSNYHCIMGNENGRIVVSNCLFQGNSGFALLANQDSVGMISQSQVIGRTLKGEEQAHPLFHAIVNARLRLKSCQLQNGPGPGALADQNSVIELDDCRITGNKGAGLVATNGGKIIHKRCLISGNSVPVQSSNGGQVSKAD